SRNQHLNEAERRAAPILYKSLQEAERMIKLGERQSRNIIRRMEEMIKGENLAKIDYLAIVDGEALKERERVEGKVFIALAVRIGKTRLIDNLMLEI
ncbi:pantoate--beta-alanine ligase, partial [bacterium]|nr:pantoate--beta-alanine ligase [bacterium]